MKHFLLNAVALLLVSVHTSTYSANLNADQQVNFYGRCMPSCVRGFDNTKLGSTLKDKPFFFEAYCGCYCARIASRLSQSDVTQMMSDGMTKGNAYNDEFKAHAFKAGELCMAPLVEP